MGYAAMRRIMLCMALILMLAPTVWSAAQIDIDGYIDGGGANTTNVTVFLNLYHENGSFVRQVSPSLLDIAWNQSYYQTTLDNLNYSINYTIDVLVYGPSSDPATGNATTHVVTPADIVPPPLPAEAEANVTMSYSMTLHDPADDADAFDTTQYNWSFPYTDTPLNYTIILSESGNFASPDLTASTNQTTYLLNVSTLSPGDYDWVVRVHDHTKPHPYLHQSEERTLSVMNATVTIQGLSPVHGSWVNDAAINVSFTTDKPAICALNTNNDSDYTNKTELWHTNGTDHWEMVYPTTEGENWFFLQCAHRDFGIVSPEADYMLRYDTLAPNSSGASVTVENGNLYSLDTTLSVNWSGFTDMGSGMGGYYVNISDEGTTVNGISTGVPSATITGVPQGNNRVYVWGIDNTGNIGTSIQSPLVIVDSLPPSFSSPSNTDLHNGTPVSDDLVVEVTVTDSSPLAATPTITYRKWDQSLTGPVSMTNVSGTIQSGKVFRYHIPAETGDQSWRNNTGEYVRFNITATDMHGRTNILTREEYIEEQLAPPVLDPIPDYTILQNESLTFNITAEDNSSGDTLTYTCNLSDAALTKYSEENVGFSFTPSNADDGTIHVRVNVTDGIYIDTQTFTITVINVNDPPSMPSSISESYTAYVGKDFSLDVNASDPDGDTITYNTNSSIYSISRYGEILTRPLFEHRGVHEINLTVSDGYTTVWETITISTEWCGDGICNGEYENSENCSLDCEEDSSESSAIIIYPRNCLNKTMRIQAVRLVPRATCEHKGSIIDDMEVCGNLSEKDLRIERVINDTYELVAELVTDENGIVTYTPPQEGEYRLTLSSNSITETFSTKECLSGDEDEDDAPSKIKTEDGKEINKTIERPKQLPVEEQETSPILAFLIYLVIPLLSIVLAGLGAGYYYHIETTKVSAGKIPASSYVAFMDTYFKNPVLKVYQSIIDWVKGQEFIYYLVRKTVNITGIIDSTVRRLYKQYMPKPKDKLLNVPFLSMKDANHDNMMTLMAVAANIFVHPWLTRKEVLEKVREGLTPLQRPYSLITLAMASMNLRNTVAYNKVRKEDSPLIQQAAQAGVKVHAEEMDLKRLRKRASKKRSVMVTIKAKDPLHENKVIENVMLVNGFDEHNVIVHDFLNLRKNRRIKNEAFLAAWRNTGYEMLTIRKR